MPTALQAPEASLSGHMLCWQLASKDRWVVQVHESYGNDMSVQQLAAPC